MASMTKHGAQRMRERNGFKAKAAERMTERIFADGIRRDENTTGRLRKWVDHVYYKSESLPIIYGDKCYIYTNDDQNRLITVINIPPNIMKDKKKMIRI